MLALLSGKLHRERLQCKLGLRDKGLTYTSTLPAAKSDSTDSLFLCEHSAEISATRSGHLVLSPSSTSREHNWCTERELAVNTSTRDQLSREISRYSASGFTASVQRTMCSCSSAGVVNFPMNSPSAPEIASFIQKLIKWIRNLTAGMPQFSYFELLITLKLFVLDSFQQILQLEYVFYFISYVRL